MVGPPRKPPQKKAPSKFNLSETLKKTASAKPNRELDESDPDKYASTVNHIKIPQFNSWNKQEDSLQASNHSEANPNHHPGPSSLPDPTPSKAAKKPNWFEVEVVEKHYRPATSTSNQSQTQVESTHEPAASDTRPPTKAAPDTNQNLTAPRQDPDASLTAVPTYATRSRSAQTAASAPHQFPPSKATAGPNSTQEPLDALNDCGPSENPAPTAIRATLPPADSPADASNSAPSKNAPSKNASPDNVHTGSLKPIASSRPQAAIQAPGLTAQGYDSIEPPGAHTAPEIPLFDASQLRMRVLMYPDGREVLEFPKFGVKLDVNQEGMSSIEGSDGLKDMIGLNGKSGEGQIGSGENLCNRAKGHHGADGNGRNASEGTSGSVGGNLKGKGRDRGDGGIGSDHQNGKSKQGESTGKVGQSGTRGGADRGGMKGQTAPLKETLTSLAAPSTASRILPAFPLDVNSSAAKAETEFSPRKKNGEQLSRSESGTHGSPIGLTDDSSTAQLISKDDNPKDQRRSVRQLSRLSNSAEGYGNPSGTTFGKPDSIGDRSTTALPKLRSRYLPAPALLAVGSLNAQQAYHSTLAGDSIASQTTARKRGVQPSRQGTSPKRQRIPRTTNEKRNEVEAPRARQSQSKDKDPFVKSAQSANPTTLSPKLRDRLRHRQQDFDTSKRGSVEEGGSKAEDYHEAFTSKALGGYDVTEKMTEQEALGLWGLNGSDESQESQENQRSQGSLPDASSDSENGS